MSRGKYLSLEEARKKKGGFARFARSINPTRTKIALKPSCAQWPRER